MADIFISYASEDRSRVKPLAESLQDQGWSVWWDRKIPPGKKFSEVIEEEVSAAKCVIVIWSIASVKSDYVQTEAAEGAGRRILVPAMIDEVRIPFEFKRIHAADLKDWKRESNHEGFQQLIGALTGLLGPPPIPEPPITAPRKPKPNEAPIVETKVAEPERSESKTDIAKPPRKFLAVKIGVLLALVVVIVAGAISLFRPGPLKSFTNSIGMEFVLIPAGSFTMGSSTGNKDEEPLHNVKISQSFYLQTTEVSQGQWKKVVGGNPSHFKQCGDDCPVEWVSWQEAKRFIEKLNQLEKTKNYRLPSEAEWEYACRAGTTTEYSFGDDISRLGQYSWYGDKIQLTTHKVANREPNPWGLYDMHGNVWEWVEDDYHASYEGAPDYGQAWVDNPRASSRVMRGGDFNVDAWNCRSAVRAKFEPGKPDMRIGFRLARSIPNNP